MQKQIQPVIYLLGYYYSYSFLYECPFGKKLFKMSIFPIHAIYKYITPYI